MNPIEKSSPNRGHTEWLAMQKTHDAMIMIIFGNINDSSDTPAPHTKARLIAMVNWLLTPHCRCITLWLSFHIYTLIATFIGDNNGTCSTVCLPMPLHWCLYAVRCTLRAQMCVSQPSCTCDHLTWHKIHFLTQLETTSQWNICQLDFSSAVSVDVIFCYRMQ